MAVNYTAVLITAIAGFGLIAVLFVASSILSPRRYSEKKVTTYECGMLPLGRFWTQVHIRYYIFGILFVLFDVEAVFLFPWAIVFLRLGPVAFYEMVIFLAILLFGLLYAWKKGVLQWK
ncbi:MAG: NADH-quinone oxidoreductase subunit A [Chloroflexi bacterium]|nr:NADH-quinone oxidoreductase subunit A [Chloroflexota bacterium]